MEKVLTYREPYGIIIFGVNAAVAQSVVRRIGSAEVTGPIPVSSSARKERKPLIYKGFRFFYSLLAIHSSCAIMITVWTGT